MFLGPLYWGMLTLYIACISLFRDDETMLSTHQKMGNSHIRLNPIQM